MARPVTLYSLQWGDLPLEEVCKKAKAMGYDGIELGLPDHLDVRQTDPAYYKGIKDLLARYDMKLHTISTHLVGQAVCDNIDGRHRGILPDYIWGDGDPEGVRTRAAEELVRTARAAKMLGVDTVVGFTGSSIWHLIYSFPPVTEAMIEAGFADFARRFTPILDEFAKLGWRCIRRRSLSTPCRRRGLSTPWADIRPSGSTTTRAIWAIRGSTMWTLSTVSRNGSSMYT